MKIIQPDINVIYSYIVQTHRADRINVTMDHITHALNKKVETGKEVLDGIEKYYCIGHFKVINYALKLAGNIDFPAKSKIYNEYQSEKALEWINELHSIMMYPVADYAFKSGLKDMYIQKYQCGTFRNTSQALAFSMAPEPYEINKILKKWIIDIHNLDMEVKDKIENPYGISMEQYKKMKNKIKEIPMFFSCLSPFYDGNNRIGKLIENIFRLRWGMPWRTISEIELESYNKELSLYQNKEFKKWG